MRKKSDIDIFAVFREERSTKSRNRTLSPTGILSLECSLCVSYHLSSLNAAFLKLTVSLLGGGAAVEGRRGKEMEEGKF